jgi:hypothetical protein
MPAHIGFLEKARMAGLSLVASIAPTKKFRAARSHFAHMSAEKRAERGPAHQAGEGVNLYGNDAEPKWYDRFVSPTRFYEASRSNHLTPRYVGAPGNQLDGFRHDRAAVHAYSTYRPLIERFAPNQAHGVSQTEWDLYLAKDTDFDEQVQTLFELGYKLLLIKRTGSPHLKRIEALHDNVKKPLIIWTAA